MGSRAFKVRVCRRFNDVVNCSFFFFEGEKIYISGRALKKKKFKRRHFCQKEGRQLRKSQSWNVFFFFFPRYLFTQTCDTPNRTLKTNTKESNLQLFIWIIEPIPNFKKILFLPFWNLFCPVAKLQEKCVPFSENKSAFIWRKRKLSISMRRKSFSAVANARVV